MKVIYADNVLSYIDRLLTCGLGKNKSLGYIRKFVENLPSVEPVRGEWLKAFRYMRENIDTGKLEPVCSYDCPICNYHTGNQGAKFNFCPNCGCDMREKVEE